MKEWQDMATDIWVAVMGALITGGTPFVALCEDGSVGFGIDYDTAPDLGYSLN